MAGEGVIYLVSLASGVVSVYDSVSGAFGLRLMEQSGKESFS